MTTATATPATIASLRARHAGVPALGMATSAALALAFALAVDASTFAMGGVSLMSEATLAPGLPQWLAAAAWCAVYPLWGLAHWTARHASPSGRQASWWIVALMVAAPVHAHFAAELTLFWRVWVDVAFVLLTVAAGAHVHRASRRAFLFMLPSLAWIAVASLFSVATLAHSWSPGFAASSQGAQA